MSDLLDIYNLKNLIEIPTRIGKTSETLLDLILINNIRRILTSGVVDVHLSDHSLIYTFLWASAPRLRSRKVCLRILKHFDSALFRQDLNNAPYQIMEVFDDVDDKYYVFESLYIDILNEHAPLKQFQVRGNQVPFMNEQWSKAIRHRNRLWKQFIRERNDTNYATYKVQRNKCTSLRRNAIKNYFLKKTEADNPCEFWNAYRPFMHSRKSKQANDILLKEQNAVISDKQQIADTFNDHFVNIANGAPEINEHDFGVDLNEHPSIIAIQDHNKEQGSSNCFNFQYINKMQVEQLISNLNVRKSCGHDSISPRLVKESASARAGPLTTIMNESIRQCRYPVRWKMGQVTPLFKKNDELSKTNYRPVTVLPVINNYSVQIEDFFAGILSDFISSYRRNYSCERALIRLTEDWKRCRDNKETVAVVSMDLSKAFDTIPHSLLLSKLKAYGLSDTSCKLLDDYLTGRTQRVKIGDTYSKWKEIKRGVPQGSVLGPMLFNELEKRLLHELNTANTWYNPEKHQAMVLGTTNYKFSFPVKNSMELFGMTIDTEMNFREHISSIGVGGMSAVFILDINTGFFFALDFQT